MKEKRKYSNPCDFKMMEEREKLFDELGWI
jgi:hypothetical protein